MDMRTLAAEPASGGLHGPILLGQTMRLLRQDDFPPLLNEITAYGPELFHIPLVAVDALLGVDAKDAWHLSVGDL